MIKSLLYFISALKKSSDFPMIQKNSSSYSEDEPYQPCYHFYSSTLHSMNLIRYLLYPAAITGGSCRSLTFRLGAPLRSHLPFTLSLPSQPPGILCNDSRACTLFVTVFLFMTIVYRSTYVCICKVCKFYFFRYFFTSSADRFSTSSSGKSSFVSSSLAISNSPISVSKWASLSITTGT